MAARRGGLALESGPVVEPQPHAHNPGWGFVISRRPRRRAATARATATRAMRAASRTALDARALATRAATGRGRRRDATATASVEKIPRGGATREDARATRCERETRCERGKKGTDDATRARESRAAGATGERTLAVCLGKFDAMHRGHLALAERAATRGDVVVVSFSGMAETLGWETRLPITAPSDRSRVLAMWSGTTGAAVSEHALAFGDVRELSPEAFVEMLARMGVGAVVTGKNYRFGYKAAGDVEALKRFGEANGLTVDVVDLVPARRPSSAGLGDQVSSSRIRSALSAGDIDEVNEMLGREHRVVCDMTGERAANALRAAVDRNLDEINLSLESAENQPPSDGAYSARVYVDPVSTDTAVSPRTVSVKVSYGRLSIDRADVPEIVSARERVAIDFIARESKVHAFSVSGRWNPNDRT